MKKQFFTFDSIRKMVEVKHWARGYLDDNYDMVFFDEAQDCDPLMLKMLLNDTTIPKVFVGDPKQAIYGFRGGDIFTYLEAGNSADGPPSRESRLRGDAGRARQGPRDRLRRQGHCSLGRRAFPELRCLR